MDDITSLGIFIACFICTLGLVRACEWLKPHERARSAPATSAPAQESRQ